MQVKYENTLGLLMTGILFGTLLRDLKVILISNAHVEQYIQE